MPMPFFINTLRLTSPSHGDDISSIAIQPLSLTVLMHMCYCYSLKWKYESVNNTKSGVVTFRETKTVQYESMKRHERILGEDTVDKLYEYKDLGVAKNYIGSLSSDADDNIEKTHNKAGMIFSSQ